MVKKINKFLEMYHLIRLNQEETETTNRPITSNKIESVIFTLHYIYKSSGPDGFRSNSYHLKEEKHFVLLTLLQKFAGEQSLPN